jgi:Zn-dependent protease with chaperone function
VGEAARRFYQRYFLLTTLLPVLYTTLLSFATRYWAGQQDFETGRLMFFLAGGLYFAAAAAGMPFFSALGFRLSGLPRIARRMTEAERSQTQGALDAAGALNRDIEALVLDLPAVPFLAISAGRPDRIWISTSVLNATRPADLRALIVHERSHLAARGWFDDIFAHWAYFTVASSVFVLPLPWSARLLALALTPWLLLKLKGIWAASREREADKLAVAELGRETYLPALLRYLALMEQPPGSRRLRLSRLRGMGMSQAEAGQWVEAGEAG